MLSMQTCKLFYCKPVHWRWWSIAIHVLQDELNCACQLLNEKETEEPSMPTPPAPEYEPEPIEEVSYVADSTDLLVTFIISEYLGSSHWVMLPKTV